MASSLACPLAFYTNLSSYRIPDKFCIKNHTQGSNYSQIVCKEQENHPTVNAINKSSDSKIWCALTCVETHRILGLGLGTATFFSLALAGDAFAVGLESQWEAAKALIAQEPKNALSLPTWVIHVSSVVEWIVAMSLVWQYGDKPTCQAWKGLSWGMVPLLGGALCACTWHFFYNAESLEVSFTWKGDSILALPLLALPCYRPLPSVMLMCSDRTLVTYWLTSQPTPQILVAIQAALTLVGNFTMLVAAFRIYDSTKGGSETS